MVQKTITRGIGTQSPQGQSSIGASINVGNSKDIKYIKPDTVGALRGINVILIFIGIALLLSTTRGGFKL